MEVGGNRQRTGEPKSAYCIVFLYFQELFRRCLCNNSFKLCLGKMLMGIELMQDGNGTTGNERRAVYRPLLQKTLNLRYLLLHVDKTESDSSGENIIDSGIADFNLQSIHKLLVTCAIGWNAGSLKLSLPVSIWISLQ